MIHYLVRRIFYAVPILIGVNLLTFLLFFVVNSPDDMARMQLGQKRVSDEAVLKWKQERGYDKPRFFDTGAPGAGKLTNTIFFENKTTILDELVPVSEAFKLADLDFNEFLTKEQVSCQDCRSLSMERL